MPISLGKQARKAHREMIDAAVNRGANCMSSPYPERWTGWIDDQGRYRLPSDEEAEALCAGCELLGKECLEWASKGLNTGVVLNGKVYDTWKEAYRGTT